MSANEKVSITLAFQDLHQNLRKNKALPADLSGDLKAIECDYRALSDPHFMTLYQHSTFRKLNGVDVLRVSEKRGIECFSDGFQPFKCSPEANSLLREINELYLAGRLFAEKINELFYPNQYKTIGYFSISNIGQVSLKFYEKLVYQNLKILPDPKKPIHRLLSKIVLLAPKSIMELNKNQLTFKLTDLKELKGHLCLLSTLMTQLESEGQLNSNVEQEPHTFVSEPILTSSSGSDLKVYLQAEKTRGNKPYIDVALRILTDLDDRPLPYTDYESRAKKIRKSLAKGIWEGSIESELVDIQSDLNKALTSKVIHNIPQGLEPLLSFLEAGDNHVKPECRALLKALKRLEAGDKEFYNPYWFGSKEKLEKSVEAARTVINSSEYSLENALRDQNSALYKALNKPRLTRLTCLGFFSYCVNHSKSLLQIEQDVFSLKSK